MFNSNRRVAALKKRLTSAGVIVLPDTNVPVFYVDGEIVEIRYCSEEWLEQNFSQITEFAYYKTIDWLGGKPKIGCYLKFRK